MQMSLLSDFIIARRPWLADAGLETDAVFHASFELPAFAAFTLLVHDAGRDWLAGNFNRFFALA